MNPQHQQPRYQLLHLEQQQLEKENKARTEAIEKQKEIDAALDLAEVNDTPIEQKDHVEKLVDTDSQLQPG